MLVGDPTRVGNRALGQVAQGRRDGDDGRGRHSCGASAIQVDFNYKNITIDFSHASVAKVNSIDLLKVLGDRVAHIHLADGTGSALDEHLVPGRGDQDCATLLNYLANNGFKGHIAVEISTRKAPNDAAREADLREALEFARKHARAAVAPVEPESVDSSGA